jgi:hypothetical protein
MPLRSFVDNEAVRFPLRDVIASGTAVLQRVSKIWMNH